VSFGVERTTALQ